MPELTLGTLALLFAVAAAAGCIDAIAGGGGLITIPTLLATGMPPAMALGTNKLQGTAGSLSASIHFVREGAVNFRKFWPAFVASLVGGALGALAVQQIDPGFLRQVIPFLLIAIAVYMILAKKVGEVERHQRITIPMFAATIGFGIGFYDGFFGPGTGTFFALGCVALLGLTLPVATAHSKVLNFASNIASLVFFIIGGKILWLPGLTMAAGQFLGAQVGARLVFKGGSKLIRVVLVVVSIALATKLLLTPAAPKAADPAIQAATPAEPVPAAPTPATPAAPTR
jgi:uncharacterized membrane protein YfcA